MFPIDSRNKPSATPAPRPADYVMDRTHQTQAIDALDDFDKPANDERRRRLERRFNTRRYAGRERRRARDRRKPELLDARYGKPERLADLRGAQIDLRV